MKLTSRFHIFSAIGSAAVLSIAVAGTAGATPVQWTGVGSNGHWYETVAHGSTLGWNAASTAAVSSGGYLATLTTLAEHDFVVADAKLNSAAWQPSGFRHGPWIGGFQGAGATTRTDNWQWVNGDLWSFTIWDGGEPNDSPSAAEDGQEDYLHLHGFNSPEWNDIPESGGQLVYGYIIEWNVDPSTIQVPEPATLALLGLGLAGIGFNRRKAT